MQIYKQIFDLINNSQNILLIIHTSPDGDAIGSVLSFYQVLKNLDNPFDKLPSTRLGAGRARNVEMFVNDKLPADFDFLPYFNLIKTKQNLTALTNKKFDLIIALDSASFNKSGLEEFLSKINYKPKIINIDHHITNDNFGDINLVDVQQSCVCEILFNLFKLFKPLKELVTDEKVATALLTGIITDTDYFINPNTTHQTLQIAGELVKLGAKRDLILKNIYQQSKIRDLRLWGKALSRLSIDKKTETAVTVIFQDDFDFNFSNSAFEGFANFLNSLSESKMVMVIKEEDSQMLKGSLRTTRNDIDVSKIAQEYGGGGHRKAAGFRVRGKIVKTEDGGWKIEKRK